MTRVDPKFYTSSGTSVSGTKTLVDMDISSSEASFLNSVESYSNAVVSIMGKLGNGATDLLEAYGTSFAQIIFANASYGVLKQHLDQISADYVANIATPQSVVRQNRIHAIDLILVTLTSQLSDYDNRAQQIYHDFVIAYPTNIEEAVELQQTLDDELANLLGEIRRLEQEKAYLISAGDVPTFLKDEPITIINDAVNAVGTVASKLVSDIKSRTAGLKLAHATVVANSKSEVIAEFEAVKAEVFPNSKLSAFSAGIADLANSIKTILRNLLDDLVATGQQTNLGSLADLEGNTAMDTATAELSALIMQVTLQQDTVAVQLAQPVIDFQDKAADIKANAEASKEVVNSKGKDARSLLLDAIHKTILDDHVAADAAAVDAASAFSDIITEISSVEAQRIGFSSDIDTFSTAVSTALGSETDPYSQSVLQKSSVALNTLSTGTPTETDRALLDVNKTILASVEGTVDKNSASFVNQDNYLLNSLNASTDSNISNTSTNAKAVTDSTLAGMAGVRANLVARLAIGDITQADLDTFDTAFNELQASSAAVISATDAVNQNTQAYQDSILIRKSVQAGSEEEASAASDAEDAKAIATLDSQDSYLVALDTQNEKLAAMSAVPVVKDDSTTQKIVNNAMETYQESATKRNRVAELSGSLYSGTHFTEVPPDASVLDRSADAATSAANTLDTYDSFANPANPNNSIKHWRDLPTASISDKLAKIKNGVGLIGGAQDLTKKSLSTVIRTVGIGTGALKVISGAAKAKKGLSTVKNVWSGFVPGGKIISPVDVVGTKTAMAGPASALSAVVSSSSTTPSLGADALQDEINSTASKVKTPDLDATNVDPKKTIPFVRAKDVANTTNIAPQETFTTSFSNPYAQVRTSWLMYSSFGGALMEGAIGSGGSIYVSQEEGADKRYLDCDPAIIFHINPMTFSISPQYRNSFDPVAGGMVLDYWVDPTDENKQYSFCEMSFICQSGSLMRNANSLYARTSISPDNPDSVADRESDPPAGTLTYYRMMQLQNEPKIITKSMIAALPPDQKGRLKLGQPNYHYVLLNTKVFPTLLCKGWLYDAIDMSENSEQPFKYTDLKVGFKVLETFPKLHDPTQMVNIFKNIPRYGA